VLDHLPSVVQHLPSVVQHLSSVVQQRQGSPAVSAQTNKAQLSASVASQVDAARSGLELLDSAQKTLKKLQHCYQARSLTFMQQSLAERKVSGSSDSCLCPRVRR